MKRRKVFDAAALLDELTDEYAPSSKSAALAQPSSASTAKTPLQQVADSVSTAASSSQSRSGIVAAGTEEEDLGTAMGASAGLQLHRSKKAKFAADAASGTPLGAASSSNVQRLSAAIGPLLLRLFPGASAKQVEERLSRGLPLDLRRPEPSLEEKARKASERERTARKRAASHAAAVVRGGPSTFALQPQPAAVVAVLQQDSSAVPPPPPPPTRRTALPVPPPPGVPAGLAAPPAALLPGSAASTKASGGGRFAGFPGSAKGGGKGALPAGGGATAALGSGSLFAMAMALGPPAAVASVKGGVPSGGFPSSAPPPAARPVPSPPVPLPDVDMDGTAAQPAYSHPTPALEVAQRGPAPAPPSAKTVRLGRGDKGWGWSAATATAAHVAWWDSAYEGAALVATSLGSVHALTASGAGSSSSGGGGTPQVRGGGGGGGARGRGRGAGAAPIFVGPSIADIAESIKRADRASAALVAGGAPLPGQAGYFSAASAAKQSAKAAAGDAARRRALPVSLPHADVARALGRGFFTGEACPAWVGARVHLTRCTQDSGLVGQHGVVAWVGGDNFTLLVEGGAGVRGGTTVRPVVVRKVGTWVAVHWPCTSVPHAPPTHAGKTLLVELQATALRPDGR